MRQGFLIYVKDYKAEIVEFTTLQIYSMPDGTKNYFVHTKHGDEFFYESDLHSSRSELEQECEELNKALGGKHGQPKSVCRATK